MHWAFFLLKRFIFNKKKKTLLQGFFFFIESSLHVCGVATQSSFVDALLLISKFYYELYTLLIIYN